MAERRSLIEGITPSVSPVVEKAFVFGPMAEIPTKPEAHSLPNMNRVPLSTRIRSDLAAALKRASLERQLANENSHTVQDILEEAIDAWLRLSDSRKG